MEDGSHEESWECYLPGSGHLKLKNTPPGLLSKIENKSGEFTLLDTQAIINGDSLELVDPDVDKTLKPKSNNGKGNGKRKLAVVTGDKSVLVVRVIGADVSTTSNMGNLTNYVFGTSGDTVNLKSQYAACSFQNLRFNPTTNAAATNGVKEVTITETVNGAADSTIQNAVSNKLATDFGASWQNQFDHIMYCLP